MTDRRQLANAIRALSMDAVQRANSGHPGMPMGMADIAEVLYNDHLKHNPANPDWWDRDRFVVSNGHGSMLLYSVLHLTGYGLSIDDLKNFRQLHSPTAGPSRVRRGAGRGNHHRSAGAGAGQCRRHGAGRKAAGRALQHRRAHRRRPLHLGIYRRRLPDGRVSHEVCSLAGTWGLGKLVMFYDDNGISIDGEVDGWFTDNTPERFRAYGWQVIENVDGHDPAAVNEAIRPARANSDQPTLICCKTTIGFGSPNKAGTAATHGAPLGDEEIAATRRRSAGRTHLSRFPTRSAPAGMRASAARARENGRRMAGLPQAHPELAAEFERRMQGELPEDFDQPGRRCPGRMQADDATVATRKASGMSIEAFGPASAGTARRLGRPDRLEQHQLVGQRRHPGRPGERQLHLLRRARVRHDRDCQRPGPARWLHRLHRHLPGVFRLRPQCRAHVGPDPDRRDSMSTPMTPSAWARTVPTHQPVEHTASLRLIPNLEVWRPADKVETAAAWGRAGAAARPHRAGADPPGPAHQPRDAEQLAAIARGGYVLSETESGDPQAIIMASGSEVGLAVAAAEKPGSRRHRRARGLHAQPRPVHGPGR
jgi:transketolase